MDRSGATVAACGTKRGRKERVGVPALYYANRGLRGEVIITAQVEDQRVRNHH